MIFSLKVHALLYSVIPCILLAIINLVFLSKLYTIRKRASPITSKRMQRRNNKASRLNLTVIILTIIYVICTAPAAYVEFYLFELLKTQEGVFLLTISDTLAFSYNAFNFFILYNINHRFESRLRRLFSAVFKKKSLSSSVMTSTTRHRGI